MSSRATDWQRPPELTLGILPAPAKALATCIILVLGIGMLGALGQIIVHDIIPTFYAQPAASEETRANDPHAAVQEHSMAMRSSANRGDLFADLIFTEKRAHRPLYQQKQFVWALKWTHIHLFGMSMIFILIGGVTIWLDVDAKLRIWLVVLPFVGVLVDILAIWLKSYVSPAFFWLHVPGGGLFSFVFCYVSLRALWEMWIRPGQANR